MTKHDSVFAAPITKTHRHHTSTSYDDVDDQSFQQKRTNIPAKKFNNIIHYKSIHAFCLLTIIAG